ncbi:hypothetical protein GGD56_001417 [Rhizobium mongolense]|uniref:Secreted protein n=2 Tax=Rhizobium mongolense TaxID=57676 RepID=A0ABR6II99_9HYPH|nr:hypothetical protein [Rhizobium mongolense]TVZ72714.1 hypothetical protein BCL32_0894 [Rhizobium mongolense USDA 1844]
MRTLRKYVFLPPAAAGFLTAARASATRHAVVQLRRQTSLKRRKTTRPPVWVDDMPRAAANSMRE